MIYTLIGTLMIGVGAASLVFLLGRLSPLKPPRWLMPVAAGGGMIAFTIWGEYAWFDNTRAALSDEVLILEAQTTSTALRPWTLMSAPVNTFMAVTGPQPAVAGLPGHVLTDVHIVRRWNPTRTIRQLVDCPGARRADVGQTGPEDLDPTALDWFPLDPDRPLWQAVCPEPTGDG